MRINFFVFLACLFATAASLAARDIVLTHIPSVEEQTNAGGTVQGKVLGGLAANAQLCAAIHLPGAGLFVKPTFATADIAINPVDGSFSFDSTTGGCDSRWNALTLTVIPISDSCPLITASATAGDFETVLAQRVFHRQPSGVDLGTQSLWIKDSGVCSVGPHNNDFRRTNVLTDSEGLKLSIGQENGGLTASEVVSRSRVGHGRYVSELTLPVGGLPDGNVLGFFSWDASELFPFAEVDFEIGDALIPGGNAQCIVQGSDVHRFTIDAIDRELTIVLDWLPGEFRCEIHRGHVADRLSESTPFESFATTNNVPDPGENTSMRINHWVFDATSAGESTVLVKSVDWRPMPECGIELVETPEGLRDLVLHIGSVDASSTYSLVIHVLGQTVQLVNSTIAEIAPAQTFSSPFFVLPPSYGAIALEAKLTGSDGSNRCISTLRYDVATDQVL